MEIVVQCLGLSSLLYTKSEYMVRMTLPLRGFIYNNFIKFR